MKNENELEKKVRTLNVLRLRRSEFEKRDAEGYAQPDEQRRVKAALDDLDGRILLLEGSLPPGY